MSIGLLFWVLMVLWFVLGIARWQGVNDSRLALGGDLLVFILLFLLGWAQFGFVIHA